MVLIPMGFAESGVWIYWDYVRKFDRYGQYSDAIYTLTTFLNYLNNIFTDVVTGELTCQLG